MTKKSCGLKNQEAKFPKFPCSANLNVAASLTFKKVEEKYDVTGNQTPMPGSSERELNSRDGSMRE